jgi:hypothetical protein
MDVDDIVEELTLAEEFPEDALRAAAKHRDALVPIFLREIDDYVNGDEDMRLVPTSLFLGFHLLGEWRETSAYRPLARLLRLPEDDVEELLGDAVTETGPRVMAALCDGDPQPLYDIVLDEAAGEYVRASMCESLAVAARNGIVPREEVARFLREAFTALRPQGVNMVWEGWQAAVAALGLGELAPLVRQACERGFIDTEEWLTFADFEGDLARVAADPAAGPGGAWRWTLFDDTIGALKDWAWAKADANDDADDDSAGAAPLREQPAVNPYRHVGRNDPCPCGSGKKFKKCCLQ